MGRPLTLLSDQAGVRGKQHLAMRGNCHLQLHLPQGLQLNLAIILSARLNGLTAFKVLLSLLPRNEPTQQHFTRVLGIRGSLKSDSVIGKWRL